MAVTLNLGNKSYVIPESSDPCDLWRGYFDRLKKDFGQANAKMLWLLTWQRNGSSSCTTNAEFNRFLKRNEIDVSSAATRTVADVSAIGGNLLGLGKSLTKMLAIGVPVTLGVIVLVIIVLLLKTGRDVDAKDIAALTPAGRGMKWN